MNRIDKKFNELKKEGQKALITYITAGDPDIEATQKLTIEMINSGADIIELGIPFSDPVSDGPVIQSAAQRALNKNVRINSIMNAVENIRRESEAPILFLVYYNCIYQYGIQNFLCDASDVGIDGLIIPDLPFEESIDIKEKAKKYGIYIISMATPTSIDRLEMITSESKGFIYCVSSTGVTGTREKIETSFLNFISEIKRFSDTPRAIGFGISGPEQVKQLRDLCEGIIVGSAIVKIIEKYSGTELLYKEVRNFVKQLKNSLNMI